MLIPMKPVEPEQPEPDERHRDPATQAWVDGRKPENPRAWVSQKNRPTETARSLSRGLQRKLF